MFRKSKSSSGGKKVNGVPVFEKNNKHELKNYGPISLLHVSSKILERLLYDSIFKFFIENSLISQKNQPGFKPGDFCTNQFLSIMHQILKSFDDGLKIRFVFLDMSKSFDKV